MSRLFLIALFLIACGEQTTILNADVGPSDMSLADVALPDAELRRDSGADHDQGLWDMGSDVAEDVSGVPDPFTSLPLCGVPLIEAFSLERLDPPTAGSNTYQIPTFAALDTFQDAVRAAIAGEFTLAMAHAEQVDYHLCRGEGSHAGTVLFEPEGRGSGHAVLAIRLNDPGAGRVMFQAPHILHDQNTLAQSVRFFEELNARTLLSSGTHRCAGSEPGCSGTSSVCDRADGGYPESDMAHSVQSFFHAAHNAVSQSYPQDLVVSVHGMARAGVSVSNGTTRAVAADTPVARIVAALVQEGIAEVTACNSGTLAPQVNYLCGGTNTQGRHLNGSADACFQNPSSASERFVHMEQERALRDNPTKMVSALRKALFVELGI